MTAPFSVPETSEEAVLCEQTIIQSLMERGRLTPQGLERAVRLKGCREEARLLQLLSMLGLVCEREIAEGALARILGVKQCR